ncbi:MAG: hypothetical protein C0613_00800 [Desulfobulbaceae bacterium]|nr:MAG: hypothetical protein C0613_00800 [Desulfobulbaceae bacterium]
MVNTRLWLPSFVLVLTAPGLPLLFCPSLYQTTCQGRAPEWHVGGFWGLWLVEAGAVPLEMILKPLVGRVQ